MGTRTSSNIRTPLRASIRLTSAGWVTTIAPVSGACCVLVGFLFESSPALLLTVAAIWGASVVADSAQFSACVTELGDPRYLGTALTLQTSIGFLLTMVSIRLLPIVAASIGWQWVFICLVPGPVFGVLALRGLRGADTAPAEDTGTTKSV